MNAHGKAPPIVLALPVTARSWQHRLPIAFAIIFLISIALVMRGGLGPTVLHDSLAVYWVWADQFTNELASGNPYPRWLPDSYAGLGSPVFYYYPPLAFYLTALLGLAGLSTYASLIAAFGCAFAGSGIACWFWLRERSSQPLLGAGLFMAAPYHLFDYVDRGALAESVAIALVPIVAIGLRRIAEDRGGIIVVALAYAAMIVAHLPLALLTGVFLIIPYAVRYRSRFARFSLAVGLGIGISAIYLLPALALEPYHDSAQLYRSPFLRTGYWSLLSGNWNDPTYDMIFLIVGVIIAAATAIMFRRRDRWAVLAIAVAVIVSGIIPFFWSLPVLYKVQFPYRALPIAEFALATALASLPGDRGLALKIALLPLLVSAIVLPGFYSTPRDIHHLQAVHPDTYEYLPRGVLRANQTDATLKEVLAPRVPPPRVPGMVVEPRFYFPAWSCAVEEPRTKLLMHRPGCTPRLSMTAPEKIGSAISLLSLFMLFLFAMVSGRIGDIVARRSTSAGLNGQGQ